MCRHEDILICNGRVAGDSTGAKTFSSENGSSTIDLFLASLDLFPQCKRLAVLPQQYIVTGSAVSDHCPAAVELLLSVTVTSSEPCRSPCPHYSVCVLD